MGGMTATTVRFTPQRSTKMACLEMWTALRSTHATAAPGRMATSTKSHWGRFSSVRGASMAPHIRAMVMVSWSRSMP